MKKLVKFTSLLTVGVSALALTPTLSSCARVYKVKGIIAKLNKEALLGETITRDDFDVELVRADGQKEKVTEWETSATLPYTFVDLKQHDFKITYKNFETTVSITAVVPTGKAVVKFECGEHGSLVGELAILVDKGTPWRLVSKPVAKPDKDYIPDAWLDSNGDPIDPSYPISGDFTAKLTFKYIEAGERGITYQKREMLGELYYVAKWNPKEDISRNLVIPAYQFDASTGQLLPIRIVSDFTNCDQIVSVTIPETVMTIENNAFGITDSNVVSNLRQVTIADDSVLETIGFNAFAGCGKLEGIVIPKTVKTMYHNTFDMSSIEDPALSSVHFEEGSALTTLPEDCFKGCKNLKTITLPTSLKTLGGLGGTAVESIAVPDTVELIEKNCFYSEGTPTGELKNITFNSTSQLKTIEEYAFKNTQLTSINIPDSTIVIDNGAFENCSQLTNVNFSDNSKLQKIGTIGYGNVFAGCPITTFAIPATVENIAPSIFGSKDTAPIQSLTFKDPTIKWKIGTSSSPYQPTGTAADKAKYFKINNDGKLWQIYEAELTWKVNYSERGYLSGDRDYYVKTGTLWKDVKKPTAVPRGNYVFDKFVDKDGNAIDDNYKITDDFIIVANFVFP